MQSFSSMEKQEHAIVLPIPYQGHINPLLNLSLLLSHTAGFAITFVNTQANHARILQSLAHDGSPFPPRIQFLAIPDGLPPTHKRDLSVETVYTRRCHMSGFFDELVGDLIHDTALLPPVTCIIYDMFLPFVAPIAHKYGIPSVAFFPQSAASFCCHHVINRAFSLHDAPHEAAMPTSHLESLMNSIPGVPLLQWTDTISFLRCADPSDFFFDNLIRPFKLMHEPSMVVVNSCEALEDCSMLKEMKILSIGPMLPFPGMQDGDEVEEKQQHASLPLWQEEKECLKWLDMQKPASVVYVSYGSMAVMCAKQLEEFVNGLESTGMPVLWILRQNIIVNEESWDAVASMVERVKRGHAHYVVCWAPQTQVLSHTSIGLFVTHCGWNSTVESIMHGVPMVCWPWFADQKLNARLIVDKWRMGVTVEGDEEGVVKGSEVERKVRCVMEEKAFRERAAALKNDVWQAVREGEGIKSLVERIRELHGRDA